RECGCRESRQVAGRDRSGCVACQVSECFRQAVGGPNYSTEAYPFRDFTPHIRRLFDAYGPQRCYWRTDITNVFVKATFKQLISHVSEELTFLSEQDKDGIMGRAILARLGWT